MENDNKRMIGDYEVLHSISVGTVEIFLGSDLNAAPGERYMCGVCSGRGFLVQYSEVMVSDDYAELLQLFGQRIAEKAEALIPEPTKLKSEGIDDRPVINEGFLPLSYEDNLNGKVVLIKPEMLKPEYQRATRQYQLCTGGFGSSPNSRGSACYCTNLYSGETNRYERMDVLGIVPEEQLPNWAKAGLERIEMERNSDREVS